MKEIEANKKAWGLLSEDHYHNFRKLLSQEKSLLNNIITTELGDIQGKSIIHLQCNTGADTISLARLGATVTGVDLVPENIEYARKLAEEFGVSTVRFIESDIMELAEKHGERYDIVFTSEGVIGWLPDLDKWGATIKHLLKDDGFFYINDSHPYFMTMDEEKLKENQVSIKYPYFNKTPDVSTIIGGYASEPKEGENYFWMYTMSDIINSLAKAGLAIDFFHEFDTLCWNNGGMEEVERGVYQYPFFKGKFPFQFSLKATVRL
ncbi:class I SAM-dependent methyltransferase [Anaerobacillus sp. CMMVII]|uniref:class I SAM-dependent methyltransferase n=1 Tax=Anaerobacillus sp. CMMVII TaxID=2755588 RepID=UPI0021B7A6AA|nr:class I SAM-dependent methyltransferase [Anaerobacillus sp. CMMVII]MCT8138115.1 class I SAM-dependent methyltransferase [Anaerobacillus sp. CMMVII]